MEYSCPIWDPYRQGDVDKLNKIQRAAARFVTNNYQRKSSVTALIQDLGWTDLQTRRKNFRLTSLYKILNGLIAVPVSDLLAPADERTRSGHKKSFKHIRANTTLGQNSFLYKTIPDWNHLPPAAIESRSIAAFKSQLSDRSGRPLSTIPSLDTPLRRTAKSIFKVKVKNFCIHWSVSELLPFSVDRHKSSNEGF